MFGNGNSFGEAIGNSMDTGDGIPRSAGQAGNGRVPASASWLFTVLVWRI